MKSPRRTYFLIISVEIVSSAPKNNNELSRSIIISRERD